MAHTETYSVKVELTPDEYRAWEALTKQLNCSYSDVIRRYLAIMADARGGPLDAGRQAHGAELSRLSGSGVSPHVARCAALDAAILAAVEAATLPKPPTTGAEVIAAQWGPSQRYPLGKHYKGG